MSRSLKLLTWEIERLSRAVEDLGGAGAEPRAAAGAASEAKAAQAPCTFEQHQQQRNDVAELKRRMASLLDAVAGLRSEAPLAIESPDQSPLVLYSPPALAANGSLCAADGDAAEAQWRARWLVERHAVFDAARNASSAAAHGALDSLRAPVAVQQRKLRVLFLMPRGKGAPELRGASWRDGAHRRTQTTK